MGRLRSIEAIVALSNLHNGFEFAKGQLEILMIPHKEYFLDSDKGIVKLFKNGDRYEIKLVTTHLLKKLNLQEDDLKGLNVLDLHPNPEEVRQEFEKLELGVEVNKNYSISIFGKTLEVESIMVKESDKDYTEYLKIKKVNG